MFAADPTAAIAATVLAAMGIVGGAVQARLGSPDTAAIVERFGLQPAASVLWARASAAPLAVLLAIVFVYHGVVAPGELEVGIDLTGPARLLLAAVFLMSTAVSIQPLRKAAQ